MSTMQRLSMIGLYNYDSTLFDNLTLPEGYDKATFINALLLEHGEKLVLYTDPDFFKVSIGIWSNKWALELSRIYEALTAEYNPIYNYDRYEDIKESHGIKKSGEAHSGLKSENKPKFDVTTEQIDIGSTEHQISADNSSDYQPERKEITDSGKIKQHTEGSTQDISETSNSHSSSSESANDSHSGHMYGNIGVTTSAAMVSEVVRQRFQYNLYSIACKIFASELLIGIY